MNEAKSSAELCSELTNDIKYLAVAASKEFLLFMSSLEKQNVSIGTYM